jgi:phage antirepressor YoqD-like protein
VDSIIAGITTMTSIEIAQLTGKEHGHVRRDIARMLEQLGKDPSSFGCIYKDAYDRDQQAYQLPYDETVCLLTGYDVQARMVVIKRWRELEAAAARPQLPGVPQTFAQALRLAAEQAEVIEQQALQLEAAKPAVEFVDRYVDATGVMGFRQVAKVLKVKEHVFSDFLIEKKIMYRLGGVLTPMAAHLDAGRFVVKAGHAQANNHAFNSARFTPKGVNWVAGEFAKYQVERELALY